MSISFRVNLADHSQPLSEQTRALIVSSFPKICRSYEQIEADHRLFWSYLPGSYAAFAFGGTYHIPLGIWVHAWKKRFGVTVCPNCGKQVNFTFTNGALSGGWSSGYCSECGAYWSGRLWSVNTWAFLKKDLEEAMESGKQGCPSEGVPFEVMIERLQLPNQEMRQGYKN